ncbi:hypothetical protein [Winogradskyella sp. 3972H.M.0a.05]|uniref:hypothetical protein n=1 Tax=Winogradskyella sp. 3972H.M.0a.05 TaxID=2950277 RepID=UPI00339959C9
MQHIVILFVALFSFNVAVAQITEHKGYQIIGDYVVFIFNKSDYEFFSNDEFHDRLETSEVYVKSVAVAGEFNGWSRDAWQMKKAEDGTYTYERLLSDFSEEFDWEFKFVINGNYWAEPSYDDPNIVDAKDEYGKYLHVYNLKLYSSYASKDGNARFRLKGYTDAKTVILSGTFNRWDESIYKMNKVDDGWELTLQLKPDIYEYKFIVDGEWIEDPDNPAKKKNEYHGYNSLINIKVPITFTLLDYKSAKEVILAGDFNDWSEQEFRMRRTDSGWAYTTFLSGGKHHYKFIVDGSWITDPDNPVREYDGKGNINSVYMVRN